MRQRESIQPLQTLRRPTKFSESILNSIRNNNGNTHTSSSNNPNQSNSSSIDRFFVSHASQQTPARSPNQNITKNEIYFAHTPSANATATTTPTTSLVSPPSNKSILIKLPELSARSSTGQVTATQSSLSTAAATTTTAVVSSLSRVPEQYNLKQTYSLSKLSSLNLAQNQQTLSLVNPGLSASSSTPSTTTTAATIASSSTSLSSARFLNPATTNSNNNNNNNNNNNKFPLSNMCDHQQVKEFFRAIKFNVYSSKKHKKPSGSRISNVSAVAAITGATAGTTTLIKTAKVKPVIDQIQSAGQQYSSHPLSQLDSPSTSTSWSSLSAAPLSNSCVLLSTGSGSSTLPFHQNNGINRQTILTKQTGIPSQQSRLHAFGSITRRESLPDCLSASVQTTTTAAISSLNDNNSNNSIGIVSPFEALQHQLSMQLPSSSESNNLSLKRKVQDEQNSSLNLEKVNRINISSDIYGLNQEQLIRKDSQNISIPTIKEEKNLSVHIKSHYQQNIASPRMSLGEQIPKKKSNLDLKLRERIQKIMNFSLTKEMNEIIEEMNKQRKKAVDNSNQSSEHPPSILKLPSLGSSQSSSVILSSATKKDVLNFTKLNSQVSLGGGGGGALNSNRKKQKQVQFTIEGED